jgi:hypothetical protein
MRQGKGHTHGMLDDLPQAPIPWERLDQTREEMARELGVSVRTLQRRWREQREAADVRDEPESPDFPWVELVERGQASGDHYDLRTDELVKPPGPFRISNGTGHGLRVQHAGRGQPIEVELTNEPAKFKPKRPKRKRRGPDSAA